MNRRTALACGGLVLSTLTGGCNTVSTSPDGSVTESDGSDEWPETFFAPYHNMVMHSEIPLIEWSNHAGTDYLHFAFVHAGPDGRPAWNGEDDHVVGESSFDDRIRAFQDEGGRAIISFGGAAGDYLAGAYEDPEELADALEQIIDEYGIDYFDINDEIPGENVFDIRNEALAMLQERRPELKVAYTLQADTGGIGAADLPILDSAIPHGVEVAVVNPMTMNFNYVPPSAEYCISALEGTHDQLADRFPERSDADLWSMIGATPMIGQNTFGVFYPDDARQIWEFARDNGVRMLSFWSVERDNPGPLGEISPVHSGVDQEYYEYSQTFNQHNS